MTIEQADREHLRLYQAFRALANAAADVHPLIAHTDKRTKFGNAVHEAWRVIETTKPILSPTASSDKPLLAVGGSSVPSNTMPTDASRGAVVGERNSL